MISTLMLKVFERMSDRNLAGMLAAGCGGSVTERTVRNWIGKRTKPDPDLLEQLVIGGRRALDKDLEGKDWPAEEREAFAAGIQACPGIVSGLAYSLVNGANYFPAFMQLAREIDLLEQALAVFREHDDVQGWVRTLLDANWIRDEHLTNPDDDIGAEATRRKLLEAKSWKDLDLPVRVLVLHTLFELLTTLDLEFCASYLSNLAAVPIFASLMPRFDPRVQLAGKTTIPVTRDLHHYPIRRLLDAVACLRAMRESTSRKWPANIPTADDMGRWLELAGAAKLASNLPKWRSGRTLTSTRFGDVWDAWFYFVLENERPPAPMPMMFAATAFTELYVDGSREKCRLTFISPDPAFYLHWWNIRRRELVEGPRQLHFGTGKWMVGNY